MSAVLLFCQIVYSTCRPVRSFGSVILIRYAPSVSAGSFTSANGRSGRSDHFSGYDPSKPGSVRYIRNVPVCGIVETYFMVRLAPGDSRVAGQSARARSRPR